MKRFLAALLCLALLTGLAACEEGGRRRKSGSSTTETTGEVHGSFTDLKKGPGAIKVPGATVPTDPQPTETVSAPTETEPSPTEPSPTDRTPEETFLIIHGPQVSTIDIVAEELTMAVPLTFSKEEMDGFVAAYSTSLAGIYIIRQGFDSGYVDPNWTVEQYATELIKANPTYNYSPIDMDDGYALSYYTYSGYFYLSAMYKSEGAFWYFQFASEEQYADVLWECAVGWLEGATYNN